MDDPSKNMASDLRRVGPHEKEPPQPAESSSHSASLLEFQESLDVANRGQTVHVQSGGWLVSPRSIVHWISSSDLGRRLGGEDFVVHTSTNTKWSQPFANAPSLSLLRWARSTQPAISSADLKRASPRRLSGKPPLYSTIPPPRPLACPTDPYPPTFSPRAIKRSPLHIFVLLSATAFAMWQTFGFFLGMLSTGSSLKIKNDVGRLPALGWNSWNAYEDKINEALFLQAADKLVQLGLKDAGYVYVNIDDCWQVKDHRDYSTNRLIPDPVKFPNGIKGLADKIHQMGLKLGIYSSAGTLTCAGYQASIGYESIDAATWADWGIDYLKYDNCNVPQNWTDTCRGCVPEEAVGQKPTGRVGPNGTCLDLGSNACPPDYDYSQSNTAERFRIMRDAILAQDRPMLYSLCEWGEAGVQQWGPSTGSSWRMSGDIKANWPRIMEILNENSFYLNNVDFYGHPDADMLEVGNGDLTIQESRSHFALWAAMKSPLLIGTDLNKLTPEVAAILGNKPLLAFNQDNVYGKPAMPFKWDWSFNSTHPAEYWSGNSQAGTLVLVLNTQDTPVNKTVYWSEVPELNGKGDAFRAVDVWSGQDIGCMQWGFEVEVATHDTQGLIVGEPCQKTSGGPKAVTHLQQSSGATSSSKRSLRGPKFFGLW